MPVKSTAVGAAVVAVAALSGNPVSAHHSVLALVDTSQRLEADMVLTKVDWINPHAWFHFRLTKPDGTVVTEVPVEWVSIAAMHRSGVWSPEAFVIGETYKVTYNPNRDGTFGGEVVTLVDETGHVFSSESTPGPGPDPTH